MKPDHTSPETTTPLLSPSIGKEKGLGVEGGSWLLRWNPDTQPSPEILLPQEPRSDFAAHLQTGPAGFVLFEGYLFDKTDYLSDPDASPAACVARAYNDYGEEVFDHLRGGYALAIWDQERGRLLAARDAMGLHPCYYHWNGRLFLLSPDLNLILAQAEVNGHFNRVILAERLEELWNEHQRHETFYGEINRLPAAHQISLEGGLLDVHRYWDPLPPGFNWANAEEIANLQSTLERAVARCLDVGGDSLALSGGFDSVSLAVLAAEQLDGRPPLHALSLRFDVGAADEGEIQTGVARLLGMPQIIHDVSDILGKKSIVRASLDLSQISPIPIFGLWQSMYTGLLESASLRGLRKLLMGTGGDEIFYVDARYAADCLLSFELAGLWRFFRSFARASSSSSLRIARNIFWTYSTKLILVQMFRSALEASLPRLAESLRRRHLALEGWLVPSDPLLREKLMHRRLYPPKVEKQSMEGYYARAIRSLPQSPILMAQHEQSHCWAGEAGFTMFYPYFDRDLVELSLRLPPEYLVSGSQAKAPLRRLVAERLHGLTLPPRKVAFTQPYDSILRGQGLPVWRELHELTRLVELDLVAPQHLTPIIEDYFAGKNNQRQITWSILSAEYWLRAHMK